MAAPYHAVVRLPQEGGAGTLVELAFNEKGTADTWWNNVKSNIDAISKGASANELKRSGQNDTWFVVPKTTSDAIVALQTDPKFANIKDNWVVKSAPSPDAGAAGAGDKAAPEGLEAQIQKLSEQVAAIAKGIEAPGKDLGANWQEGPNWKGGHDSYLLVDQAYKTCLRKKDEGDDRSFHMMFSQEMMELRRRQRG